MDLKERIKKAREKAGSTSDESIPTSPLGVVADKSAFIIPIDQIEVRDQARKTFSNLEELGDSIRREGQLQAIVVRKLPTGKYLLIDGERRLRAIRDVLRYKTLRASLQEGELEPLKIRVTQLSANQQREGYPPLELAKELADLKKDTGYSDEKLGTLIGVSASWVCKYRNLHAASPEIKARIAKGSLTLASFFNNRKMILQSRARDVFIRIEKPEALQIAKLLQEICEASDRLAPIKITKKETKVELSKILSDRTTEVLAYLMDKNS